jgi:hypothetical protein
MSQSQFGRFATLPVGALKFEKYDQDEGVDDSFLIKRIAAEWNAIACGALSVSRRADGTYWVYDGRVRLQAARRLGITELPCMIYEGLSREQEATNNYMMNNFRVNLTNEEADIALRAAGKR